jgi:hypothetical protein
MASRPFCRHSPWPVDPFVSVSLREDVPWPKDGVSNLCRVPRHRLAASRLCVDELGCRWHACGDGCGDGPIPLPRSRHRMRTAAVGPRRAPASAPEASGSLGREARAQRVEHVLGRPSDVVDLAIDKAHPCRVGRLPGDADDGARTQPDVPVGLVLNWMKSLMVGLRSAARFAARLLPARLWAAGSSGRGFCGDCGHRAVEGLSNRGDDLRNCGARLPRDRLLTWPRLRARTFGLIRAGPLGAALLRRSRRTPLASGLLLCGRLLPLGGNGACSGRLTSRASGASLLFRFTRRHGHLLLRRVERVRYGGVPVAPTSSAAPELGTDPAIPRPGRRRIRVFEPGGRPPSLRLDIAYIRPPFRGVNDIA